jgi:hypothetical protein
LLLSCTASSSTVRTKIAGPPKPAIGLVGAAVYQATGKDWVRHHYSVRNWTSFPADMFAVASDLPPCGRNPNASRTWVDFYDSAGRRLYGFCALKKPADLQCLWFATELGTAPPAKIYIELTDRRTGKKYRSNLAVTGPARPTAARSAAGMTAAAKLDCPFGPPSKGTGN